MKKSSIKAGIYTLLIGILATAIWEKLLSPLCTYIYINLSSLFEKFITTFSNNTYIEISKGYNDYAIIDSILAMLAMLGISLLVLIFFFRMTKDDIILKHLSKRTIKIIPLITILLTLFFLYRAGNIIFINKCKTTSLCNLEIVCPYVSDLEYKKLRSSFYSIQNKEDYEAFTNTIKKIGEMYSLNLKE